MEHRKMKTDGLDKVSFGLSVEAVALRNAADTKMWLCASHARCF